MCCLKRSTPGKSDGFFAYTLTLSCASLIRYELARMAEPSRGAQGGTFEVWVALAKCFFFFRNPHSADLCDHGRNLLIFLANFSMARFHVICFCFLKNYLKTTNGSLSLALGDRGYPGSIWVSIWCMEGQYESIYSSVRGTPFKTRLFD